MVVLRMMSTSSLSSGTTSSTKRGMVGTTGGAAIKAAFFALNRNLGIEEGFFNVRVKILPQNTFQARINSLPFLFAFLR